MNKYFLPDYQNCSVNILSSVAKVFDITTGHQSIPLLDKVLENKAKNIVVILLDGFGEEILNHNLSPNSFLSKHKKATITSVFPTTTTAGTMTFKTGLTPLEHGWISQFLYFKEIGKAINLYLNTDMYSKKPIAKPHIADSVLDFLNIFEKIEEKTNGQTKAFGVSIPEARDLFGKISQLSYDNFSEMCDLIKTLCSTEDKKVIYAYHNHPDDTMHKFGPYSSEAKDVLLNIDAELENLTSNCPDTTFIISADHGQTYIDKVYDIANYPDIVSTLLMSPTGGSRAFNFFIKKGNEKKFKSLIKKYFKDEFVLFSKKEVLSLNLFGQGAPHPKIDDFLGDFWLISVGHSNLAYTTLYNLPIKEPVGSHGGLTKEEIFLPLIVFQTK